ncbi:MAG: biotin--[acetyl-CoA-carboxylase] ligase [Candidatus Edwardsbacteria bacterium]
MIGKKIYRFTEIDSTQDFAKEIADEAEEGTIIIAEVQKKGRGRLNRVWFSPPGGVYLSVILKPPLSQNFFPPISLLASIAVAKAIKKLGLNPSLKWPNDVLLNGKKVAGILTETNSKWKAVILGIGINANLDIETFPEELRETTSIKKELQKEIVIDNFIKDLEYELNQVYFLFIESRLAYILKEWKSFSQMFNRRIEVRTPTEVIEGKAVDLDEDGALLIEMSDGSLRKIIAGNVKIL